MRLDEENYAVEVRLIDGTWLRHPLSESQLQHMPPSAIARAVLDRWVAAQSRVR
ncbi:MAG: hypothetical protein M3081_02540 [Gemmatimonadota bacterium]|nr:hypothetical protein [Gemmatimonadota bacterium]